MTCLGAARAGAVMVELRRFRVGRRVLYAALGCTPGKRAGLCCTSATFAGLRRAALRRTVGRPLYRAAVLAAFAAEPARHGAAT